MVPSPGELITPEQLRQKIREELMKQMYWHLQSASHLLIVGGERGTFNHMDEADRIRRDLEALIDGAPL